MCSSHLTYRAARGIERPFCGSGAKTIVPKGSVYALVANAGAAGGVECTAYDQEEGCPGLNASVIDQPGQFSKQASKTLKGESE